MLVDGKGQGAVDCLMTYGWAIMVMMVVGLLLWQMGAFGHPPTRPTDADCLEACRVNHPETDYAVVLDKPKCVCLCYLAERCFNRSNFEYCEKDDLLQELSCSECKTEPENPYGYESRKITRRTFYIDNRTGEILDKKVEKIRRNASTPYEGDWAVYTLVDACEFNPNSEDCVCVEWELHGKQINYFNRDAPYWEDNDSITVTYGNYGRLKEGDEFAPTPTNTTFTTPYIIYYKNQTIGGGYAGNMTNLTVEYFVVEILRRRCVRAIPASETKTTPLPPAIVSKTQNKSLEGVH
ncbi:hypothetical protein DRQ25_00280 [Candidatus Fermentibacteria bacterium]|nr:MAG: hypothetical protein DRQ25_00280 [Candidatus Fermentibacteria bacterium]